MSGILVYALHHDGAFNRNSLGAVSEAARLAAELGVQADAVVVGGEDLTDELCSTLGGHGAARVWRASAAEGLAPPVVDVMAQLVTEHDYGYALFGGGLLGFEVGAGLAARLGAGVTMEVTRVAVEDGGLIAERPILGDSLVSVSRYRGRGIVVGRLNAFPVGDADGAGAPVEDVEVELSPWSARMRMVSRGEQRGADLPIEDADLVLAGGRGLGRADGFAQLEDLARALGGAVAATRAVVDAGWYPYAAQIGQTGKTVAPKLYLAAGISGAVQHKVGMQASEHIVAINKDASAPIFEYADLGVVGDLNKIVPRLAEAIRSRK